MARTRGPVIWGIDLAEKNSAGIGKVRDTLSVWNVGSKIIPVSVLQPLDQYSPRANRSQLNQELVKQAIKNFAPTHKRLGLENLNEHRAVFHGPQGPVRALVELAEKENASFIAVNTHSRRGLKRWQIGSFAEGLIGCSPVPVLTVNPQTKPPVEISTILFATKFSTESRRAFKMVLQWARERKAKLVLVHKFETPFLPGIYGDYGANMNAEVISEIVEDAEKSCQRHMESWVKAASKVGLKCQGLVVREPGRIAESVLLTADDVMASVIVMTTHRGPLGQRLIGSAAREVLTTATCPVIILHESKK